LAEYDTEIDRESAFEKSAARAEAEAAARRHRQAGRGPAPAEAGGGLMDKVSGMLFGTGRRQACWKPCQPAARNAGGQISRSIMRGVLGGIFKGR
jgi:hypothetical protein